MKAIEVPKGTGTYADSLRAIGTASLLEEISGTQTIIRDMGTHFQIECPKDVSPEGLKPPSPGFYYIWKKSKEKDKPSGVLVLDYEEEKSRADVQKKGAAKRKKVIDTALEEQGLSTIEKPHREYRPAAILESMRKGWSSDKDVYHWVVQNSAEALKWVQNELGLFEPLERFEPLQVSNSQFYNPASGKGVHSAKTVAKSPGAISNEVVQPFAEWMKYRGAYIAMLPYRNGDDFKLFVIEPAEIGPKALSLLREKLLDLNLWGGIRLDIEASLRLAEELIMHSDVMGQSIGLRRKRPAEVVRGLRQAFFKSMGTAAALMNDAFLPLPNWFRIENREEANAFLGIIREHIGYYENGQRKAGCLGSLDETHSGDVPILQQYRKWLTTGGVSDLLDFLARFAVYIMEKRGKKEWAKEFSTENLTILFERGYGMKEIVENPGFLSVARGIRNCTIYAVSLGERETHFGLAQQWKQKIKGGIREFVPVLCDFVQTQNWEVEHRLKGKGHSIKKEDLDSVIGLIEKHGVELVGMLLLAYGYARAPRIETEV
ncbi:MAG TPA: hypothetical protein ACFYEK_12715 [Candidatus Wunengus sp. YC60]|uniref:hypothetical protein n=1 Tax=Candidatus Wunengus sp. YC60 TaxID=3367697 RepID=UPI00402756A0